MAYEQKDNSGSIFKNDRREKDTHPHAKGDALIDGVSYWISAWTKTDRNGNKFQSLSFKRKDGRQDTKPERKQSYAEQSGGSAAALDDEVPFAPEFR